MPAGPSRCSITAKATWRFNRLKLREIELDDGSYGLGHRAVLLIGGQCVQPCRILLLEVREAGDCVVPALDPAAPVDRTADANDRLAIRVHGTVARLTFGAGHGRVTDRWTGHGSTPEALRDGMSYGNRTSRNGLAPVRLAALHHGPHRTGDLVGQRDSGQFARPALQQLQQPFVGLLVARPVCEPDYCGRPDHQQLAQP